MSQVIVSGYLLSKMIINTVRILREFDHFLCLKHYFCVHKVKSKNLHHEIYKQT